MGCDIHMYTEALRSVNKEMKWVNVDNWRVNPYYSKDEEDGERPYQIVELYGDRNYTLFSILADVRNYSNNKPISQPKGIPSDVSKEVKEEYIRMDSDGHSHSWFTLKELKEFTDSKSVKYSGLISQEQAEELDNCGIKPTSWCQGASDSLHYVYREWTDEDSGLEYLIELITKRMNDVFWIWDDKEHPDLWEKIRIVFWFDN